MAPIFVVLTLQLVGLGYSLAKDGKRKEDRYSFGWSLFCCLVGNALLWWGSWFAPLSR